jgi:hypothetical protein
VQTRFFFSCSLPTKGFASGEFTLTFEEANPNEIYLTHGNSTLKRYDQITLQDCEQEKKNLVCTTLINLSDFDGQDISYSFNITDLIGNYAESKSFSLKVDATPPQVTEFDYSILGKNVEFIIGIQEINFDEILYLDREETNPRFRTLCPRLTDGLCEEEKRFSLGNHVLDIIARDEAGNEAVVISGLSFSI